MATPFHFGSCSAMAMAQTRGQAAESFRPDRLAGPPSARRFSSAGMACPQHRSASLATRTQALSRVLLSKTRAVAVESNQVESPQQPPEEEGKSGAGKYYFVVANAKFMLDEEEHFKELMFERLRNFGERNREQDFWLVIEPKFLDKFPSITSRLRRPAVALISTDGPWMTFMKLRLDRVLYAEFEAESLEEALACNPVDIKFSTPEQWVAPYPKYDYGWWERFLPPTNQQ
ncbi:uncharacterized protein LOC116254955 [Nymphaea colorata]|nr:uncharacterized protein LOC116254955 [Nymphaea colorata]